MRPVELRPRPHPRRAGGDVGRARRQGLGHVGVLIDAAHELVRQGLARLALLHDAHRFAAIERLDHGLEQVGDDLVAVRGDAHSAPGTDQVDDHARPGVRLARAGRALDGQRRPIQAEREPPRGVRARLSPAHERFAVHATGHPRQAAGDEVAARAPFLRRRLDAVRRDPLAEAHQRLTLRLGVDHVERHDAGRMRPGPVTAALDVDRQFLAVDGVDRARARPLAGGVSAGSLSLLPTSIL